MWEGLGLTSAEVRAAGERQRGERSQGQRDSLERVHFPSLKRSGSADGGS